MVDVFEKPQRPPQEATRACSLQIRPTVISHWGGKNRVAFSVSLVINRVVLQTYYERLHLTKKNMWPINFVAGEKACVHLLHHSLTPPVFFFLLIFDIEKH